MRTAGRSRAAFELPEPLYNELESADRSLPDLRQLQAALSPAKTMNPSHPESVTP